MKPLIGLGLFFLVPSTINVLAKAYTNEDAVIGPDGVKCTLSTVSVRKPDNLLTFDDGHCVYSTSTDQCQSGVALFQFYSPQNVCPQGTVLPYLYFMSPPYSACFNCCLFSVCESSTTNKAGCMYRFSEVLSGQNPSRTIVPCCVHIECGDRNEGKCVNTPASGVGNCKGELKVSVLHTPLGKYTYVYIYKSNQLKSAKFFLLPGTKIDAPRGSPKPCAAYPPKEICKQSTQTNI